VKQKKALDLDKIKTQLAEFGYKAVFKDEPLNEVLRSPRLTLRLECGVHISTDGSNISIWGFKNEEDFVDFLISKDS
jgi:hypothetical protein